MVHFQSEPERSSLAQWDAHIERACTGNYIFVCCLNSFFFKIKKSFFSIQIFLAVNDVLEHIATTNPDEFAAIAQ